MPRVAARRRQAVVEGFGERDRGGPDDAAQVRPHKRERVMAAAPRRQTWRAGGAESAHRRKARQPNDPRASQGSLAAGHRAQPSDRRLLVAHTRWLSLVGRSAAPPSRPQGTRLRRDPRCEAS